MDRHRRRFLASLSARLDQDRAMRESQIEEPPSWHRHPDQSDAAQEPVPAQTSEAMGPLAGGAEVDDRAAPSEAIATPLSPHRRRLTVEALRIREPDQTSIPAVPWSETGMSQALRDAIASVRRVSHQDMDELPPPRSDRASDAQPFDDDLPDEPASFDPAGAHDRWPFDRYALREEQPFDDATADERFDDRALHQEPPLAGHVADAQRPFDHAAAADEQHGLDLDRAEERAPLDEHALRKELPDDDGADWQLPFGDRGLRAEPSFDLSAADTQPPSDRDAADAQPLFDDDVHEHWAHGPRHEARDRPPLWREGTQRRNLHFAALAVAIAFVLLAGFGFGVLSGARELDRLVATLGLTALIDATVGATQTDTAPSSGGGVARPAEPEASPQLSELETVRVTPLPAPPRIEQSSEPTTNDMPLPPPPKPALGSSVSGEAAPASDRIAGAVDDAVEDAAVALLEADGAGGPFEPILAKTTLSGPRVFVHYTEDAPGSPATAQHLVRHLKAAGFTVEARGVEFPISKYSLRYFFDSDRDEAEAVSARLQDQIPGGADVPILDFTNYEPKPREGHLEVWLGR